MREIRAIASDPDDRFFFNVTDEAALTDIVDALGDRIFGLEGKASPGRNGGRGSGFWSTDASMLSRAQGSHGENESSFGLEMSQIGFSAHRLKVGQPDPSMHDPSRPLTPSNL